MHDRPAKPMLLVCNTRTGSTAFGTALALSNSDIAFYGEVFHPAGMNLRTSFPYWLRSSEISAKTFLTDKVGICRDYLRARTAGRGKSAVVFGVKYHDLLNFLPTPSLFDFAPALFTALRQLDGVIIHLLRRSVFDATISAIVAQKRQVFHVQVGDRLPQSSEKFNIPVTALVQQIRMRIVQEMIVSKQIRNSKCHFAVVTYEDIFGGHVSKAMADLTHLIGSNVNLHKMVHQKLGTNYPSLISNFNELANAARRWESRKWSINES